MDVGYKEGKVDKAWAKNSVGFEPGVADDFLDLVFGLIVRAEANLFSFLIIPKLLAAGKESG